MRDVINKNVHKTIYKDICPVVCGNEICAPKHNFGPAVRTYWILHFVISGKGTLQTQRGNYSIGKNEIFIIRPYEINTYTADETEPWIYSWIGFRAGIQLPPVFMSQDTLYAPELAHIFSECVSAPEGRGFEAFLCSRIWELISALSGDDRPTEAFELYIKPALTILENEYYTNIKIGEIADRLHVNRSYFSTLFKSIVGKAPHEYLSDLRMEKAMNLMNSYGYSVTVTANSVGFSDVFAFSRAFRNRYGISPTEYRKNISKL